MGPHHTVHQVAQHTMKSTTLLLALTAAIVPAAIASPAMQIPGVAQDLVDWTARSVSKIGSSGNNDGVHTTASWQFTDCGDIDDAIEIKSLRVSPDPPEPGKKMTIYADGLAKQRITEGAYADVVVKLGLIKLISKRFDICDELRSANASLQCPIEAGAHEIVQSVDLPKEIPKAKFVVQAQAFTQPPREGRYRSYGQSHGPDSALPLPALLSTPSKRRHHITHGYPLLPLVYCESYFSVL